MYPNKMQFVFQMPLKLHSGVTFAATDQQTSIFKVQKRELFTDQSTPQIKKQVN